MQKYIIEREMPGVGSLGPDVLCGAAKTSNAALAAIGPSIQWQYSYVVGDKTFCDYLAENADAIRTHAEKSGFPANKITLVTGMIDPTTAG